MSADAGDGGEPGKGGLARFLKDYWIWWLGPLLLAAAVVIALLRWSEGGAESPFIYDSF